MKNATLLAIISIFLQIATSAIFIFELQYFYEISQIISFVSTIGLLPFFILLYLKQKNGV